ncbi:FAR1 DNA-binding domain [Sesbania bispinosa]|nr:FAR1 DNA-binding domain [Sesbania bispinosa]
MDNYFDDPCVNLDDDKDMSNDVDSSDSGDSGSEPTTNNETNEPLMMDVGSEVFKRVTDLTPDDILVLQFGSQKEAYVFYNEYAKTHGFVVRKDEVKKDVRGNIVMRQFVCNREGLRNKKHLMRLDRKREHRALTRTNCVAKLRIRFNRKKSKWRVVSFVEAHNHELTTSRYVHLHSAYRKLSDGDKARVDNLHTHGVRTCRIMGYMLAQKGGYSNLGFSRKDVYNYIDSKARGKIKDGDALAALSY